MISWMAIKTGCKKVWAFMCEQWLAFFALAIGVLGYALGSRGDGIEEELVESKAKSDKDKAESDRLQREAIRVFSERITDLKKEIDEKEGAIELEKQREIKEIEETIEELENKNMPLDELEKFLEEKAPSFKRVPLDSLGKD